jgi:CRP/FNR family transcriptional regulator, cyclic AMP receptor protein
VENSRLAAIPLFAGLDKAALGALAAVVSEAEAEPGEALATEGDFGYGLYAVESGTAEVTVDGSIVRTLGPGDVFGEIAVLASGRRTASVAASSPMRLIVLFNRDVWALVKESPEVAARLRALIAERVGGGQER